MHHGDLCEELLHCRCQLLLVSLVAFVPGNPIRFSCSGNSDIEWKEDSPTYRQKLGLFYSSAASKYVLHNVRWNVYCLLQFTYITYVLLFTHILLDPMMNTPEISNAEWSLYVFQFSFLVEMLYTVHFLASNVPAVAQQIPTYADIFRSESMEPLLLRRMCYRVLPTHGGAYYRSNGSAHHNFDDNSHAGTYGDGGQLHLRTHSPDASPLRHQSLRSHSSCHAKNDQSSPLANFLQVKQTAYILVLFSLVCLSYAIPMLSLSRFEGDFLRTTWRIFEYGAFEIIGEPSDEMKEGWVESSYTNQVESRIAAKVIVSSFTTRPQKQSIARSGQALCRFFFSCIC